MGVIAVVPFHASARGRQGRRAASMTFGWRKSPPLSAIEGPGVCAPTQPIASRYLFNLTAEERTSLSAARQVEFLRLILRAARFPCSV
jgi:hypothetical protein